MKYVSLFSSITLSEKLADLPDDSARLLYTWSLSQADSWGRLPGRAKPLGALVWPMLGKTAAQTEKALTACVEFGLYNRYTRGDDVWLQIPDWEEKAGKLIPPSRRAKNSRWPSPEDAETASSSLALSPPDSEEEKRRDTRRASSKSPEDEPDYSGALRSTPELDTKPVREAMEAYFAFRRKKRWDRLLPESIAAKLTELRGYGPDGVAEAFRASIANGWRGVFAPKGEQGGHGSGLFNGARPPPVEPLSVAENVRRMKAAEKADAERMAAHGGANGRV